MRGIRCVARLCGLFIYIYIEEINLRGGTLSAVRTSGQVFIRDGRRRERG